MKRTSNTETPSIKDDFIAYAASNLGCIADAPFSRYPSIRVLRHPSNRKWVAIIMEVTKTQIGLGGDGLIPIADVKLDPLLVQALQNEPGYAPAWHMNKQHWLSVRLDGSVALEQAQALLDMSFQLVKPSFKRVVKSPKKSQ